MGGFFRMFFASLVALIVFTLLAFFLTMAFFVGLASNSKIPVEKNSVLVLNLSQPLLEQQLENPLSEFSKKR